MKKSTLLIFLLAIITYSIFQVTIAIAQINNTKQNKNSQAGKESVGRLTFEETDSLVNSRQFVFKADFNPGSDEVFVVVDSVFAIVQNGYRNNLTGQITQCKVKKDDKRKTISITFLMRGIMSNADVFILLGESGKGTATIKSDFPGYFSFNGFLVDFENANIYEGGSHFVH